MLIASSTHLSKWILFWTLFGAFCYDFVPKIAKLTALGCLSKQGAKQNFIAQSLFERAWGAARNDRPICAMDSRRKNAFQSRAGSRLRLCTTLLFQLSFYSRHLRHARVIPSWRTL